MVRIGDVNLHGTNASNTATANFAVQNRLHEHNELAEMVRRCRCNTTEPYPALEFFFVVRRRDYAVVDAEDEAAHAMVKKPVAVYIEKVYEEADLAGLGI